MAGEELCLRDLVAKFVEVAGRGVSGEFSRRTRPCGRREASYEQNAVQV